MKHCKTLFAAALALAVSLALFLFTACAPDESAAPAETAEPTPTATAEPTPLSTEAPAETADTEANAEIDQRFEEFLNATGDYTDETIRSASIECAFSEETLGCMYTPHQEFDKYFLQGVLLHYEVTDTGEVFAFGTKNKQGERVIALIEYPSESLTGNGEFIQVNVYSEPTAYYMIDVPAFEQRGEGSPYCDFLDSYIGRPMLVDIDVYNAAEDREEFGYLTEGFQKFYNVADEKTELNRLFLTNVYYPDNNARNLYFSNMNDLAKEIYDAEPNDNLFVETLEEFEYQVDTNFDSIPSCTFLFFTSFN